MPFFKLINKRLRSSFVGAFCAAGLGAMGVQLAPADASASNLRVFPQSAPAATVLPHEWQAFRDRFVATDGRVIDHEKRGVSHSEGQGYGMLIALYANDRATFDRILRFTQNELGMRGDRLFSWLYEPNQYPRVTDRNNASDGDILIAYALVKAAITWNDGQYLRIAEPIIDDIGRLLLQRHDEFVLLRPAAFGFDRSHHNDGPVVNLSYFIYGAFPLFQVVNDRYPWMEAYNTGLRLTSSALAGRYQLAPDWVTMRRDRFLAPANGFAKKSSYDAVRIPLYMMLGGKVPAQYIAPFDRAWNVRGRGIPLDYDLGNDRLIMEMNDLGYRAIASLTACAVRGQPMPAGIVRYRNTTYFSSALHLLTLAAARTYYPQCINGGQPSYMAQVHMGSQTAGTRATQQQWRQRHVPRRQADYSHFDMGN
ncbi:MAG: glycosyl hydrolase family 8 [Pseudomonadota bacterium]